MEAIFDWIKTALAGVRQAFLLTIFGSACLTFIYMEWWPLHGSDTITAPVAGLLLFWGASSLLVHAGAAVAISLRTSRQESVKQNRERRLAEQMDVEAVANLDILSSLETRQLLFVLRSGRPRFSGRLDNSRLDQLHIVERGNRRTHTVWEVRPVIWSMREELLVRWDRVPEETRFPG